MAYQSLYRRYRPQRFDDVVGQEHLVKALRNAVREDRVGHAYLFSGPRGTGKTTNARLLAKVLNCTDPQDGEPCGVCESCVAIQAGTSFDLHELDAASHNGVGDIRDLIEKAALGTPGRTKVYILDEVHMLSTAASNALLKTLEEPPDHVVFVLATTDPQKVLPTIRSRTQHFEVHLLAAEQLTELVRTVAADAGLEVTDEQVEYVVRRGAGSARDTLSALDQVVAAGSIPEGGEALDRLMAALVAREAGGVLAAVQDAIGVGREPRVIGEVLLGRLRDAFLATMDADLGHLAEADRAQALEAGEALGARALTHALEVLGEALIEMRQSPDPRIPLEVALIKVARPEADQSLAGLADRLERLERAVAQGGTPTPPSASTPSTTGSSPTSERPSRSTPSRAKGAPSSSDPPASGRPADGARQALADRQSRPPASAGPSPAESPPGDGPPDRPARPPKAALGAHRNRPAAADAEPAREPASAAVTVLDADTTSGAEPDASARGAATPAVATGAFPTRDELTLAWGDDVLDVLPMRAKALFKAGRFLRVADGRAEFGLPTKIHADKCEPHRDAVEQALAAHFGQPVPLRLVVDNQPGSPPGDGPTGSGGSSGTPEPDPDPRDDDVGPVHELRDADDLEDTHLQRITAAFPGAEVIADDPE
jgi:DNA polymerase-3 subunit gamma/tau